MNTGTTIESGLCLKTFLSAYIKCALWSTMDNANEYGGEPLDANYYETDIAEETQAQMLKDCAEFIAGNAESLSESGLSSEQAGHDFWLSRNGHGAGFFDHGSRLNGEHAACLKLQDAARVCGSFDL